MHYILPYAVQRTYERWTILFKGNPTSYLSCNNRLHTIY